MLLNLKLSVYCTVVGLYVNSQLLQEEALQIAPGSCQQVPLDHSNSVRFGVCRQDGSPSEAIPGWSFLQFLLHFCPFSSFGQEQFWAKYFDMGSCPHPSTRGCIPICWRWSLQVLSPPSLRISARLIPARY